MKEIKLTILAVIALHLSIMSLLIGLGAYTGTVWQYLPLLPAMFIAGWLWGYND